MTQKDTIMHAIDTRTIRMHDPRIRRAFRAASALVLALTLLLLAAGPASAAANTGSIKIGTVVCYWSGESARLSGGFEADTGLNGAGQPGESKNCDFRVVAKLTCHRSDYASTYTITRSNSDPVRAQSGYMHCARPKSFQSTHYVRRGTGSWYKVWAPSSIKS